jgi:hypothetical protein
MYTHALSLNFCHSQNIVQENWTCKTIAWSTCRYVNLTPIGSGLSSALSCHSALSFCGRWAVLKPVFVRAEPHNIVHLEARSLIVGSPFSM